MRGLLLLPVFLWLLTFVAIPLLGVGIVAMSWQAEGSLPFLLPWSSEGLNGSNFVLVLEDSYYRAAFAQSLWLAGTTALACLLTAIPMALAITRAPRPTFWLGLVLLPLWTGFLLRVGAWIGLLREQGWINGLLLASGLIEQPLALLYTPLALHIGMMQAYLPFAVLPLYATLARLDPELEEAAADLGASPTSAFLTVILPPALPGCLAAFLLVFIPAAGEYVVPELLGPPDIIPVGRALVQEFAGNRDWPVAAALALVLLILLLGPIWFFQRLERRK